MKSYIAGLTVVLGLFLANNAGAQSADPAENKRILEEKNFVFVAQNVSPQRGMNRPITSYYELAVRPDSIIAYLPYFGRAYTAPVDPTEGGIKFTSINYKFDLKNRKKKGYDIVIRPTDAPGIVSLRFTAFENGRATLQVTQTSKDPITFYGYFVAGPERSKKAF